MENDIFVHFDRRVSQRFSRKLFVINAIECSPLSLLVARYLLTPREKFAGRGTYEGMWANHAVFALSERAV